MKPEAFMKRIETMAKSMKALAASSVDVGLPKDKVGRKIYKDGATILEVGAKHEFGSGNIPQRSFLRTPFLIKRKEINHAVSKQFDAIINGQKPKVALGRIGLVAVNYSRGAFASQGYGQWKNIAQSTKDSKGSSQVLVDTGTLKNSITWVVHNAS